MIEKITKLVFAILIFFCSSCLLMSDDAQAMTEEQAVTGFINPGLTAADKVNYLTFLLKNKISNELVQKLQKYLDVCEYPQVTAVSMLLMNNGVDAGDISKRILARLKSEDINTKNFIEISNLMFLPSSEKDFNESLKIVSGIYCDYLEKAQKNEDLNLLLENSNMFLFVAGNTERCFEVFSKKLQLEISRDTKLKMLELASDEHFKYLLSDNFISPLVFCSGSKEKELADASSKLLADITHIRDAGVDWRKWWDDNKDFKIAENARRIAPNKQMSSSDRYGALCQLLYNAKSRIDASDECYKVMTELINDNGIEFEYRIGLIQLLHSCSRVNDKLKDDFLKNFKDNLKDKGMRVFLVSWVEHVPELLDDNEIYAELETIVKSDKEERLTRGFAAYSLSAKPRDKKALAVMALKLLEGQKQDDFDRCARIAVIVLGKLTEKDLMEDVDGWKKAVSEMP
ncbi:MAG TPA: hypothetical protein DCZ94_19840 [Lentisphaeria bacterium]|nr:MAG: hypothetical protein A2X48_22325 [Lentisphaerae bacterium GWF2_49_21]HBC89198.1 hypothetical protein [Lentisphaeria bacterium]